MVINQGDVHWLDLGTPVGSGPGFKRPYVVIQNNLLNHSAINTVLVCAVSSNLRRAKTSANVLLGELEANLPKQSVVVVSQLYTVDKSLLNDYIGTLSTERIRQILNGLREITEPHQSA